jgi:hypothetical protein
VALASACVGGPAQQADIQGTEHKNWVRDIEISSVRGEVGRPFAGEVTYETNYLRDPEWEVTDLPPGLRWDEKSRSIVGTPEKEGFFSVNVALRKKVDRKDGTHKPKADERWWPETFRIEVFKPVQ